MNTYNVPDIILFLWNLHFSWEEGKANKLIVDNK